MIRLSTERRCTVQIAHAIGVAEPVSIRVEFYGTGRISAQESEARVRERFDLSPAGVIKHLNLRRAIYAFTSVYGHFGRDPETLWWETVNADLKLTPFSSLSPK